MSNTAPNHYLFIAKYKDGTQYEQGADDLSLVNPEKNAFYDIIYEPWKAVELLHTFHLIPIQEGFPEYAVDVTCGAFCINGGWFYPYRVHDQRLENYRLIYLRVMRAEVTLVDGQQTDSIQKCDGYILGFQANEAKTGRNVEFIMRF